MNNACEPEWTRKFLSKNFTSKFITGELREHREKLLFDKEVAILPETQPYVEYILSVEEKVRDLMTERIEMRKRVGNTDEEIHKYVSEMYTMERRILLQTERLANLRNRITNRYTITLPPAFGQHGQDDPEVDGEVRPTRNVYTRKCLSETCHGFLNSGFKCGICSTQFCRDCHEVKPTAPDAEPHTCNPDTVATVSLMRQDTKPCPKCHFGIFKIDGCDLMWCTQCQTAFSWRTGEVQTTNIHNPHYFEWRRTHGTLERQPGDMLCGREINVYQMNQIFRAKTFTAEGKRDSERFLQLCRVLLEYQQQRLPNGPRRPSTQSLRIQYLMKEVTKDAFKVILQREDKKYNKELEVHNIKEFLYDIAKDITLRHMEEIFKPDWDGTFGNLFRELNHITSYSNDLLLEVAKTYKTTPHQFRKLYTSGFYLLKVVKPRPQET